MAQRNAAARALGYRNYYDQRQHRARGEQLDTDTRARPDLNLIARTQTETVVRTPKGRAESKQAANSIQAQARKAAKRDGTATITARVQRTDGTYTTVQVTMPAADFIDQYEGNIGALVAEDNTDSLGNGGGTVLSASVAFT
jgi:hypothetical protein